MAAGGDDGRIPGAFRAGAALAAVETQRYKGAGGAALAAA